jgi:hypothetical protein
MLAVAHFSIVKYRETSRPARTHLLAIDDYRH